MVATAEWIGHIHSEATWAPFSATERFINSTKKAVASVNTAIIQKQSK